MKRKKIRPYFILYALMILCMAGILCSVYILYKDGQQYIKGEDAYQQVRMLLDSSNKSVEITGNLNSDTDNSTIDNQQDVKEGYNQTTKYDFTPLAAINPDVAGWIVSANNQINYPIVQTRDNEYYVRRLFTRERNKIGSLFIDYRNSNDFSDKNTVIYGHNMNDGSMFSSITKYKNQKYYDEYPVMLLFTPSGDFTIELFAAVEIDASYDRVRFDFADELDFIDYIISLEKDSDFVSDITIAENDKIITLCTCSEVDDNARYALYGGLTSE